MRYASRAVALPEELEDLGGREGDVGARAVDGGYAGVEQEVVVAGRDHAAADDEDVAAVLLAQLLDELGHEGLVAGGLARDADDVHVVLDRVAGRLLRRLEQRADVDVEADVGERGRDHLGAAVVAVLAHLHDEHAGPAALDLGELADLSPDPLVALVAFVRGPVHAADATDRRPVPGEHLLQGVGDLADRRPGAHRVDRELEQVGVTGRTGGELLQRRLDASVVPGLAHLAQTGDLLLADGGVVDGADLDVVVALGLVLVDADDHLFAPVDAGLAAGGRFFDAQLRHPRLDRFGHATELLDLVDELRRLVRERVRQRLDVVAATQRVD